MNFILSEKADRFLPWFPRLDQFSTHMASWHDIPRKTEGRLEAGELQSPVVQNFKTDNVIS